MANTDIYIRRATATDIDAILDVLEPQEFIRPLTREQLRCLFTYTWTAARDLGLLLIGDDAVQGYEGIVYSPERVIEGQRLTTANLTTAFVRPKYRTRRTAEGVVRYSVELIREAMSTGCLVTVFSAKGPNNVVPRLLAGLGFEEVSSAERFYGLGTHWGTLLGPSGRIVAGTERVRARLSPERRTILEHHQPYGCGFYLIEQGTKQCFVVTKRRHYRGEFLYPSVKSPRVRQRHLPVGDVLHLSDPEVARGSWGRLVAHVALAERTAGVTCAESFFGGEIPAGTELPQKILTFGPKPSQRAVDKLYSELVLIP